METLTIQFLGLNEINFLSGNRAPVMTDGKTVHDTWRGRDGPRTATLTSGRKQDNTMFRLGNEASGMKALELKCCFTCLPILKTVYTDNVQLFNI